MMPIPDFAVPYAAPNTQRLTAQQHPNAPKNGYRSMSRENRERVAENIPHKWDYRNPKLGKSN
jgi:hypothetical protein